ncbi:class I SAM-dependent methyltransferase [Nocardia sp. NPDC059177]|uniref:class I SAM-dependent methyltransferase n=1 Tax=Nocardia sp. NPDC059177 TaxID=3346759 RepID=UPI0036BC6C30
MNRRRIDHRPSLSAQFNAAQRAAESLQPVDRRLLDDRYSRMYAGRFAPLLAFPPLARAALLASDHYYTGLHSHVVLRVRYTDDACRRAIATGIDQIVLLGAGFDTTSLRIKDVGVSIFEVDAPSTQLEKLRLNDSNDIPADSRVRWVPCDFEHDSLPERLTEAGFDPSRRCLVTWIGVSFYLTPEAFERTVADLAELSAPGSRLILDYGDPEIVTGDHVIAGARRTARSGRYGGEPYRSGFTPRGLTTLLAKYDFAECDHARIPDLARRYALGGQFPYSTDDWIGIVTVQRFDSDHRET